MKQHNRIKRLKRRQAEYEAMMKRVDAPVGHHRPGSLKK